MEDRIDRRHVLDLASFDPNVSAMVQCWRQGDISWDQAMMLLVTELSQSNRKLMENATIQIPPIPNMFLRRNCPKCGYDVNKVGP